MTFWKWSKTAANNATADSTCPFPEGMAGAALNDGTRGMMAAVAKYRDDMAGAIVTGGSVNAYTVATYQGFDTLPHLDGMAIAFSPHVTNTGAVQVNVDGLGLKPYRPSPGVDFIGGELIQGTPYVGVYNNSSGEIYARGFMSSPYAVPVFGGLDFWDTIAPNSCFIFPVGQAISRSVYARAFARWGTTFGAGDGSTTFNVMDKRGRVSAALDTMGGSAAGRITGGGSGINGGLMGSTGGAETETLSLAQVPTGITSSSGTASFTATSTSTFFQTNTAPSTFQNGGGGSFFVAPASGGSNFASNVTSNGSISALASTSNNTGGGAHVNVQPTIMCNYIMRII